MKLSPKQEEILIELAAAAGTCIICVAFVLLVLFKV